MYICNGDRIDMVDRAGQKYCLRIEQDDSPSDPREDDNIGTMLCWHRRYNLGDKNAYGEPREFLTEIANEHFATQPKALLDFIKAGKAEDVQLRYNRSQRIWEVLCNQYWSSEKDWYMMDSYPAPYDSCPDCIVDSIISELYIGELLQLINNLDDILLLPLYLYDHSGITMNTSGFSCPWDSGQVGWIYTDRDTVLKQCPRYVEATSSYEPVSLVNWKDAAQHYLLAEVKLYDQYITGETYGFILEKDVGSDSDGEPMYEECESCWGFYGDVLEENGMLEQIGGDIRVA